MNSDPENTEENRVVFGFLRQPWSAAERYLVFVLIVFGLGVSLLLPVGGGYDEETHLLRVWEMSALVFVPNDKLGSEMPFPAVYWEMSYRRQVFVRPVEPGFWQNYGSLSIDELDYVYQGVKTRSVYSPLLLLPQSIVMRYLGRRFDIPALLVFYAIRWAGLFSYLLLTWLAVRIIPFGKWPLAIVATLPAAILQAATISADAISNGIALLMIAGAIWSAQKQTIRGKEFFLLCALFFLLFNGKLNIVPLAVLPFLLLRPQQFKVRYGYWALLAVAFTLMMLEVVGWNLLAYGRLETAAERANPVEQVQYILSQPFAFVATLTRDIIQRGWTYFLNGLAIYGYNHWPIPQPVYLLTALALIASVLCEKITIQQPFRAASMLLILFVLTYLATIAAMYVTFTPVGSTVVDGVQGRYFLTVWPLLLLSLALWFSKVQYRFPAKWVSGIAVASLALYSIAMYIAYYVPCGPQYYQAGLCYQPRYKNWDSQSTFSPGLTENFVLTQEIVPECNGLTVVRIWVDAAQADPQGKTEFTLLSTGSAEPLVKRKIDNSELPKGGWYALQISPDWQSDKRLYLLEITGASAGVGPRIAYSQPGEYLAGKAYENTTPIERDILFQTGCIAGWEKLRLTGQP